MHKALNVLICSIWKPLFNNNKHRQRKDCSAGFSLLFLHTPPPGCVAFKNPHLNAKSKTRKYGLFLGFQKFIESVSTES